MDDVKAVDAASVWRKRVKIHAHARDSEVKRIFFPARIASAHDSKFVQTLTNWFPVCECFFFILPR